MDEIYRLALMLSRKEFSLAEDVWEKLSRYQRVLEDAPERSQSANEAWRDYKAARSLLMDAVYGNLGVGFLRLHKTRKPERG